MGRFASTPRSCTTVSADTLLDAIMAHGGEGTASRDAYRDADRRRRRQDLIDLPGEPLMTRYVFLALLVLSAGFSVHLSVKGEFVDENTPGSPRSGTEGRTRP